MKDVFSYSTYKAYLHAALGGQRKKTGMRAMAARHMNTQSAYLSQILNGDANLSLEQAFALNGYFKHDQIEADYFVLLVQKDRAGTRELRDYFQAKLDEIQRRREKIKERVKSERQVSAEDQAIYYSHWYYACIHVMLSIPELQSRAALQTRLNLPAEKIGEVLEFLVSRGFAISEGGRYTIGPRHIHIP